MEDSGLLDTLATAFAAAHPQYVLAPVAAGTGMVLEMGRRDDADVLMSHDSVAEEKFVDDGFGERRLPVMYNDFVIAGPPDDPAHIKELSALAALARVAQAKAAFVSRADDSGTHRRERSLWRAAHIQPAGDWYIEAGVGMGDALLLAGQKRAYILTDRGTHMKFRDRVALAVLVENDPPLINNYGVIVVQGAHNQAGGRAFASWITSPAAQRLIASYGSATFGRPLFSVGPAQP